MRRPDQRRQSLRNLLSIIRGIGRRNKSSSTRLRTDLQKVRKVVERISHLPSI